MNTFYTILTLLYHNQFITCKKKKGYTNINTGNWSRTRVYGNSVLAA